MANVFLTGASGGFGKLITQDLIAAGHKVAATLRDPSGRNKTNAAELTKMGAVVVDMDVTRDESVQAAVHTAAQKLGPLDVVINNAGVGVLGLTETFTPEDVQKIFDVNVVGVHRVNRAVLPQMRERRSGLLIHISSLLGRITVPFYGPYNASKWALEALAENYRTELTAFGVDAVIVEPGGFPTTFIDNLVRPSDKSRDPSYGELAKVPEAFLGGFEKAMASNPAQDPKLVAQAITKLIATAPGSRPFRTIVDNMGMGTAIAGYNDQLNAITAGIYGHSGIGHMLQLTR